MKKPLHGQIHFRTYMSFVDTAYSLEIKEAEERQLSELDSTMYSDTKKERSVKLFAVLASYLKNRPLKILQVEELTQDGYRVWNRLHGELQPSSLTRALAVAEALTNFPKISKGQNTLDYILLFERLAEEF